MLPLITTSLRLQQFISVAYKGYDVLETKAYKIYPTLITFQQRVCLYENVLPYQRIVNYACLIFRPSWRYTLIKSEVMKCWSTSFY